MHDNIIISIQYMYLRNSGWSVTGRFGMFE